MNQSGIYLIWLYEHTTAHPERYYGRIRSSNWTALRNLRMSQRFMPTLRRFRLGSLLDSRGPQAIGRRCDSGLRLRLRQRGGKAGGPLLLEVVVGQ